MQENRYLYIDGAGNVHGPFWLSVMRDLHRSGRLNLRTQVCLHGSDAWQPMEFHPEIYEETASLPARSQRAKSQPARLLVLVVLLLLAYVAWCVVHWNDGLVLGR